MDLEAWTPPPIYIVLEMWGGNAPISRSNPEFRRPEMWALIDHLIPVNF
jgi:hypothetical protein